MKTTAGILFVSLALLGSHVHAQGIKVEPSFTGAGSVLFELFLDTTEAEGTFDTFELIIEGGGFNQVGVPGELLLQPSEDSGFSAFLTAPPSFGGQGLDAFGLDTSSDTVGLVSGTFASLGDNSASTQGNYLIAQIVLPQGTGGFAYQIAFFDDGSIVKTSNGLTPLDNSELPEPSTLLLLASIGLFWVGMDRRGRLPLL